MAKFEAIEKALAEGEEMYDLAASTFYANEKERIRNLTYYVEMAKLFQGISSNRELSKMLGLAPNAVHNWLDKKLFPSNRSMVRLATLADLDAEMALLELNFWRACIERDGKASDGVSPIQLYMSLIRKFRKLTSLFPATLLGVIIAAPKDAFASVDKALSTLPPTVWECVMNCLYTVYYGN